MPEPSLVCVRELITELAQLEDAVRAATAPARAVAGTGHFTTELPALLAREDEIVSALRAVRLGAD